MNCTKQVSLLKKHRFQPEVIEGYVKGIYHLEKALKTEEMIANNLTPYRPIHPGKF